MSSFKKEKHKELKFYTSLEKNPNSEAPTSMLWSINEPEERIGPAESLPAASGTMTTEH